MKLRKRNSRLRHRQNIWVVLALSVTSSCGQMRSPKGSDGRDLKSGDGHSSSDVSSDKPQMTVEDVVHAFEIADELPDQAVSDSDREAWEKSLVPADSLLPADAIADSSGFELTNPPGSDEREIIDLRPNDTGVRNQGSEGTCTAFATVATMENLIKRFYGQSVDISERHHWSTYANYQTTSSLKQATLAPIVSEATWPYNGSRPRSVAGLGIAKLKNYSTTKLALQPVVDSLRKGQPVVIAVGVLTSLMNPKEGGIVTGGVQRGSSGHAIALTGAIIDARVPGGGYFIIKNSWGKNWGDKGYGYVAFDYCQRTRCSAYSIADASLFSQGVEVEKPASPSDPLPNPTPNPAPTPVPTPIVHDPVQITAADFQLKGHPSHRRGIFGMTSFYLTVEGKPEIMKQIKAIQYAPSEGSYYTVTNGSASDVAVSVDNMASPDFRTRARSFKTEDVVVKLRDGSSVKLSGITVKL